MLLYISLHKNVAVWISLTKCVSLTNLSSLTISEFDEMLLKRQNETFQNFSFICWVISEKMDLDGTGPW